MQHRHPTLSSKLLSHIHLHQHNPHPAGVLPQSLWSQRIDRRMHLAMSAADFADRVPAGRHDIPHLRAELAVRRLHPHRRRPVTPPPKIPIAAQQHAGVADRVLPDDTLLLQLGGICRTGDRVRVRGRLHCGGGCLSRQRSVHGDASHTHVLRLFVCHVVCVVDHTHLRAGVSVCSHSHSSIHLTEYHYFSIFFIFVPPSLPRFSPTGQATSGSTSASPPCSVRTL